MRRVLLAGLIALSFPTGVMAQTPPAAPPSEPAATTAPAHAGRQRDGNFTRDEYVEHAKRLAEARFDRMDADHDGTLTAEERHAWREAHGRHRAAAAANKACQ